MYETTFLFSCKPCGYDLKTVFTHTRKYYKGSGPVYAYYIGRPIECELCHGVLKHYGALTIKLKPGMERHEVDVNIKQMEK